MNIPDSNFLKSYGNRLWPDIRLRIRPEQETDIGWWLLQCSTCWWCGYIVYIVAYTLHCSALMH